MSNSDVIIKIIIENTVLISEFHKTLSCEMRQMRQMWNETNEKTDTQIDQNPNSLNNSLFSHYIIMLSQNKPCNLDDKNMWAMHGGTKLIFVNLKKKIILLSLKQATIKQGIVFQPNFGKSITLRSLLYF